MTSPLYVDQAQPVRAGEELPLNALAAYLRAALPNVQGELTVGQFARGYSNLTYLLQVGETELVLRRPPFGANIAGAHDMGREVRVLTGLAKVYAHVPQVLAHCTDPAVIGAPFYVMDRLHGVVLRAEAGKLPHVPPAIMAGVATMAVDNLAAIHGLDVEAAGLADLGRPVGYVARQVQGWTRRYAAAATGPQPELEAALAWLAAHQPPEAGATLIHNDYKYDNLMLDEQDLTRLVAVLDWEMCTLGDPLLDLGTTLGYWMEPGDPPALVEHFGLTTLPGNLDRAGVVARYCAVRGLAPFDPLPYYVYGLAKIGVILQQIYHRYVHGRTADERFAWLDAAVYGCGVMAQRALAAGRISGLAA
jgi:aminoglycoside phosphotransferase (APT) family kinase protein